jgi:hypothetical protein
VSTTQSWSRGYLRFPLRYLEGYAKTAVSRAAYLLRRTPVAEFRISLLVHGILAWHLVDVGIAFAAMSASKLTHSARSKHS